MKPFRSRATIIWGTEGGLTRALDVSFGGRLSEHVGIDMDECEVVPLLLGEARA
jgi:hypothetical protein